MFFLINGILTADFTPPVLNNHLTGSSYFSDLFMKYFPDEMTNTFHSENYYIKEESEIFPAVTTLLFFNQSYIRRDSNSFYLNIDLLSGKYMDYGELRSKCVNIYYSFALKNEMEIGAEGIISETVNDPQPNYYYLISSYSLFGRFRWRSISFLAKYGLISSKEVSQAWNLYMRIKPVENLTLDLFAGNFPDFGNLSGFIEYVMSSSYPLHLAASLSFSLLDILDLYLTSHAVPGENTEWEVTFGISKRFYFQYFIGDSKEVKRLFISVPFSGRYTVRFGPEMYEKYYLTLIFEENVKKYRLTFGVKNTFDLDIKKNVSLFLRYTYFI